MDLPSGWQLVGGLPVLADGEWCVTATGCNGADVAMASLTKNGMNIDRKSFSISVHSSFHFASAENLLREHQRKEAEKGIKEVFRSEHVTVFRRERDGVEAVVTPAVSSETQWHYRNAWHNGDCVGTKSTRPEAESAAKLALMGGV